MFKGSQNINFKTNEPIEIVIEKVQDYLESIGGTEISEKGIIKINASRFSGFACECEIVGRIKSKDQKYSLELEWEAKPNWLIIILTCLCLFGLGLVLLIIPYFANNDMQKKCAATLDNVRFDFKN